MNRVVVTGIGAITPVGNDIETFWENIKNGVCGIDYITHFDTSDYKVKIAAEVKDFDPLLYMDKSEVRRSDLYTQYALGAAKQAVEDSGIIGKIEPERFGVYVGSGIGGISTFQIEANKLVEKGPKRISPFFVPMMIANIAAGTIAIKYDAEGPCLSTVTACATSTMAVGEAYRAIKHGYADAIIAGGSEAAITNLSIAGFTSCMALTAREDPKSASIPFDKRRDGFVMGEGSAILVLEEYEHAKARGAKIYGEIVGYANTCDAYHITAPASDAKGAAAAIRQAMDEADAWDAETIYINAHGTSTPLNDKTETLAIKKALGEKVSDVLVSSTKSMTAHMLGAAGAVEAIISVLALKDGVIPPTIGYEEADPECDLDCVPNVKREKQADIALSTSLGFGGHNGCLAFRKYED